MAPPGVLAARPPNYSSGAERHMTPARCTTPASSLFGVRQGCNSSIALARPVDGPISGRHHGWAIGTTECLVGAHTYRPAFIESRCSSYQE